MTSLKSRVREYALSRGVELLVVDGPASDRYAVIRDGRRTCLVVDAGTADGPGYGEVVYRACEAICASRDLAVYVHRTAPGPLLAS